MAAKMPKSGSLFSRALCVFSARICAPTRSSSPLPCCVVCSSHTVTCSFGYRFALSKLSRNFTNAAILSSSSLSLSPCGILNSFAFCGTLDIGTTAKRTRQHFARSDISRSAK